ncbi:hypothetical protein CDAR_570921 [Caerostris darwini]|uniref:Uncharacterized protein n=1 Tax=Caerostris darwini TaxID=1538125 RepID=A0AAV4P2T5_9ARAC|nr:hypothetical protein CDAR_570921 [Caerostris darwini]
MEGCKNPRFSIRRGLHCSCPSRFSINDAVKQGGREAGMGQLATCWHSDFGCGRSQLGRELLSFACSCSSWNTDSRENDVRMGEEQDASLPLMVLVRLGM